MEDKINLDAKIAHLGFIQGVINRMGANSFLLKGWSITLVAAVFALSSKDADQRFVLLAYFPVIVFWVLDAYFLHQERLFRKLYEKVAADLISSEKFVLNTAVVRDEVESVSKVFFSKTLLLFHGLIVGIVSIVIFALFCLTNK
ncbi:MAG: hypothetical protein WCQ26_13410 [Pseudanabaena sp. ELA748]